MSGASYQQGGGSDGKTQKRLLTVLIIAAALLLAAAVMGCVDYDRVVNRGERPICAVTIGAGFDDGGSGRYYGLGYGFEIEGNFVPMYPGEGGVREWSFYIFGVEVASGAADSSVNTAS